MPVSVPINPADRLSPNFTLAEFLISQTAARYGIDNTPDETILANLKRTALLMESVRVVLGNRPIYISSGYRSPALNAAIGGVATSAHQYGQAADFTCPAYGSVWDICRTLEGSDIPYDQLIREFDNGSMGWCHIAWHDAPRHEALTIDSRGTQIGIA